MNDFCQLIIFVVVTGVFGLIAIIPSTFNNENEPHKNMNWLENKLIKWFLTQERVLGLVRHAATWLSVWMTTNGIIAQSYAETIVGSVLGIATLLWGMYAQEKVTLAHRIGSFARHILTILAAIAIFKGYLTEEQANEIIGGVLGFIAVTWSVNASNKDDYAQYRALTTPKKKL
jgi:hypothetical protein